MKWDSGACPIITLIMVITNISYNYKDALIQLDSFQRVAVGEGDMQRAQWRHAVGNVETKGSEEDLNRS
jgi:hypothetical protein